MVGEDDDGKPLITGPRRGVLGEMRNFWYRTQSRFVHQLGDAIIHAVIPRWAVPSVRTDAVIPAAISMACILSEIEVYGAARWPQPRPGELLDVWGVLARSTDVARQIYVQRYASILGTRIRPLLARADELLKDRPASGPVFGQE